MNDSAIAVTLDDSSSLRWAVDYPVTRTTHFVPRKIRLRGPAPQWLNPVVDRVVELSVLPDASALGMAELDFEDVGDAMLFLGRVMQEDTIAPWVGRLNSGGLQLNWQCGDVEVEAVFDRARGERGVLVAVGENEWEELPERAESLFSSVVDRLSQSHLEYVAAT